MSFKHTFTDSGYAVELRRISFTTLQMVRAHWIQVNPAPEPPLKEFPDGNGGTFSEKDTTNKEFQVAFLAWSAKQKQAMELLTRQSYAELALVSEPDTAAVNELLSAFDYLEAALRKEFDDNGVAFKSTNLTKYLYLWNLCITTADDYTDFVKVMTQRSNPSPASVASAVETFSSAVQG